MVLIFRWDAVQNEKERSRKRSNEVLEDRMQRSLALSRWAIALLLGAEKLRYSVQKGNCSGHSPEKPHQSVYVTMGAMYLVGKCYVRFFVFCSADVHLSGKAIEINAANLRHTCLYIRARRFVRKCRPFLEVAMPSWYWFDLYFIPMMWFL